MIYGIGTDIVHINRIVGVMARTRGRFATKVLGAHELAKYHARRAQSATCAFAFLATRFAAKEAFAKAIGLGMHSPMTWRAVQTLNLPSGQPIIVVNGALKDWLHIRHINMHVSVSDEEDYAFAWVVAEAPLRSVRYDRFLSISITRD